MKTTTLTIVAFTAALGFGAALFSNDDAPRAAEPVAEAVVPGPKSYAVPPMTTYTDPVSHETYKAVKACTTPYDLAQWLNNGIRDRQCRTFSMKWHDGYKMLGRNDSKFEGRYYDFVQAMDGTADDTYYVLHDTWRE